MEELVKHNMAVKGAFHDHALPGRNKLGQSVSVSSTLNPRTNHPTTNTQGMVEGSTEAQCLWWVQASMATN